MPTQSIREKFDAAWAQYRTEGVGLRGDAAFAADRCHLCNGNGAGLASGSGLATCIFVSSYETGPLSEKFLDEERLPDTSALDKAITATTTIDKRIILQRARVILSFLFLSAEKVDKFTEDKVMKAWIV